VIGNEDATDCGENPALADDPFPLTPSLSLGERVKARRFMVPLHVSRMLMGPANGVSKRQRTAALQDLSEEGADNLSRQRLGVRLSSAAFVARARVCVRRNAPFLGFTLLFLGVWVLLTSAAALKMEF
jgi:hypothetical protein